MLYLTAETAYTGLSDHTEELGLPGMLMAQEADACFIINAHKARVRCRQRSATLRGVTRRDIDNFERGYRMYN